MWARLITDLHWCVLHGSRIRRTSGVRLIQTAPNLKLCFSSSHSVEATCEQCAEYRWRMKSYFISIFFKSNLSVYYLPDTDLKAGKTDPKLDHLIYRLHPQPQNLIPFSWPRSRCDVLLWVFSLHYITTYCHCHACASCFIQLVQHIHWLDDATRPRLDISLILVQFSSLGLIDDGRTSQ